MITILTPSARAFISADGKRFEWRRNRENPTSYDVRAFICPLYAGRDLGLSNSYTLLKICESHAFEDYTTYSYWSLARAATVHLHVRLVVDWSSRRALYQSLDRPTWGLIAFYLLSCFLGYWSLLWYYWTTIFINYCMGRGEAGHSNIHRKYHLDSN